MNELDLIVLIGRFRPFHKGHEALIEKALEKAPYVLVLVGSSFLPAHAKNPWSYTEVAEMIHTQFDEKRVIVFPLTDKDNDKDWEDSVKEIVKLSCNFLEPFFGREPRVGLLGYKKDASSYYLDFFPEWKFVAVENTTGYDATTVRNQFFTEGTIPEGYLSKEVEEYLIDWKERYPILYEQLTYEFEQLNS